jgi:5,10-methylenetetrahydromethanopterin reductase
MLSLSSNGDQPPEVLRELARAADHTDIGTLWLAAHLFLRDPVASAAIVLANTARLRIGLMAMSPFVMHPVAIAMAAATLDEWFPGRVTLCLGAGAPRDLAAIGIDAVAPVAAISETIAIARSLFRGETVQWSGERYRAEGRRPGTGARDIPLVVAASGPRMLERAGAEADGVLISAGASPAFVAWAVNRAGPDTRKAALVYAAVTEDDATRQSVRRALAFVLRGRHHARNLALAGTALDQAALARAFADEDWTAVDDLVTDAAIANHSATGTPAQVRSALEAYAALGLDEIVLAGVRDATDLRQLLPLSEHLRTI